MKTLWRKDILLTFKDCRLKFLVECSTFENIWISKYRCFLMPLQQTAFWKHSDKRRDCSQRAISPLATMFSTFIHSIIEIFYFLTKYVQSRLLQNCCMKERVNPRVVCFKGNQKLYICSRESVIHAIETNRSLFEKGDRCCMMSFACYTEYHFLLPNWLIYYS